MQRDQPADRQDREDGADQKGPLRAERIPQDPGNHTRRQKRRTGREIEHAEGGSAQFGRRAVGDQCGKYALGEAQVQPPKDHSSHNAREARRKASTRSAAMSSTNTNLL
jgi:hypothetical protein